MKTFDIRAYGAAGDGEHKDSTAVRAAVDACTNAGGGTVYCPPGVYLCGTIFLEDNVALHLEAGATILGSPDEEDYDTSRNSAHDQGMQREHVSGAHLIYANGANHIAITGRGTIDGNGRAFFGDPNPDHGFYDVPGWRPGQMICFFDCTDVLIRDVRVTDSPYWAIWPHGCERVTIQGITLINARRNPNGDGIDADCCRDVIISDCFIDAGDDCIALKTHLAKHGGAMRACENVTVTNCTLVSPTCAVRLGFEGDGPIRNCTFSNLVITDTRRGIDLLVPRADQEGRDYGVHHGPCIENISFNNIVMHANVALFLWIGDDAEPPGGIRNVNISNLIATTRYGCHIGGSRSIPLEGLRISNMKLTIQGELDDTVIDPVPYPYPAFGFRDRSGMPYGIFAHHVRGLRLHNVVMEWGEVAGPWRNAMRIEQSQDVEFDGLVVGAPPGADDGAAVHLVDVERLVQRGCRASVAEE